MSRGPGRVQGAILFAFEVEPARRFSTRDLAEIAFPDCAITESHLAVISRALRSPALNRRIDLRRSRVGCRKMGGWGYVYGRAS